MALIGAAFSTGLRQPTSNPLRDRHPSLARGLGCGVILVILLPVILVLVVLGFCIATGAIPIGV